MSEDAGESVSDTEEGDTDTLGEAIEISISVPNLSDIITGHWRRRISYYNITDNRPLDTTILTMGFPGNSVNIFEYIFMFLSRKLFRV